MPLHGPPRLLTGLTLLFWGGLTGNALFGLIAAVLVESNSWTTIRWNFSRTSYVRAWHFSVLAATLLSALAWLDGMKAGKLHTLFIWAPLVLLPIELAQRYGKASRLPLNTFSFFARRKMEHDFKQGYHVSPRMIHISYPYLAVALLATAVACRNELFHFIGMGLILGVCLFFNARKNGMRPVAWVIAFILLIAFSYSSHWATSKAYHYYQKGQSGQFNGKNTSANESRTSIGRLGKLKLSPKIFWRAQVAEETKPPTLLRTATYHHYARGVWKHLPGTLDPDGLRDQDGYISEARLKGTNIENNIRYFDTGKNADEPDISGAPQLKIVGEVDSSVLANPIPLPHFTAGIGDLGSDTSEISLDCNTLGTVRINNPDYHIISYSVWTGDRSTTEVDAPAKHDLGIPVQEREAIKRICAELGLKKGMTAKQVLTRLRSFFATEFTYTTHLTTPNLDNTTRWTAMGVFLEQTRRGHCEYFASATALILRECGVPARYCVGFAVHEYDSKRSEWVMRGTHAHAWCRVWNEGRWEDADLTPASWLALEKTDTSSWKLKLADWWQLLREDFLIWRTRDENKMMVLIVVGSIVGVLLLWLAWQLWKSRQRGERREQTGPYIRPKNAILTDLNKLEPAISRKIGRRPNGQPLCRWVMMLEKADPSLADLLSSLTRAHSQLRFDPDARRGELEHETNQLALELKKRIKKLSPIR